MPKRNVPKPKDEQAQDAPAVMLLFADRKHEAPEVQSPGAVKTGAAKTVTKLPESPATAERPTLFTPRVREWVRIAAIASIVLHGAFILAFHLRNEDDLARASGAAASASNDGAIVMDVDVIVNAPMPAASKQTNFTRDAKQVSPNTPQQRAEPKPQPKEEQTKVEAAKEAERIALVQEELAPPKQAETAAVSEAPKAVNEEKKPEPKTEEITREKTEKQAERKIADAAPTAAANPNRSASSASQGRAGAGGNTDAGARAAVSSYQAQVLAHLQRHRVYPSEAQSRGITGVARVRFSLASNGRVTSASLAGSSGTSVLDQAALSMVQRASPFPSFPAGIQRAQLDFAAPIRFDIR